MILKISPYVLLFFFSWLFGMVLHLDNGRFWVHEILNEIHGLSKVRIDMAKMIQWYCVTGYIYVILRS